MAETSETTDKPAPKDSPVEPAPTPKKPKKPENKYIKNLLKGLNKIWIGIKWIRSTSQDIAIFFSETKNRQILAYNLVLLVFAFTALILCGLVLVGNVERDFDAPKSIENINAIQEIYSVFNLEANDWFNERLQREEGMESTTIEASTTTI